MQRQEHEFRAKQICDFFQSNNYNKLLTLNHFRQQNVPTNTIHNVIRRFIKSGTSTYKKIPGRKAYVNTHKQQQRVVRYFSKHNSASVRVASDQLGINKDSLQKIKRKIGIRTLKKVKKPKYTAAQIIRVKAGCTKLYKMSVPSGGDCFFIIDDETYVHQDPSQIPSDEYYNEIPGEQLDVEDTIAPTEKFPVKYMVWQAMAEDGQVSKPFFYQGIINSDVYMKECIKKRLVPFLNKFKHQKNILFWPDLATAHYSRKTQDLLKQLQINYVSKSNNPPNVPQCRPIEVFWAVCKARYKKNMVKPTNMQKFSQIWNRIALLVAEMHGKNLFLHFRQNLRLVGEGGPYAI